MSKKFKKNLFFSLTLLSLFLILYIYAHNYSSIPILLYHHVNYVDKDSISVTPETFESQMRYLYENNYKTLFLDEVINILKKGERVPPKSVVITIDDGYLDNWIYAYPILKKYKIKATIFVITSYIKNRKNYRPNLEDFWENRDKRASFSTLPDHNTINLLSIKEKSSTIKYFISWEEIQEMTDSGLIDIQSHTHTHSSLFKNDKIIDFNKSDYWVIASNTNGDMRLGIPIYEHASAMISKRFFDDINLRDFLADYVSKNGSENFFIQNPKTYKEILFKQAAEYSKNHTLKSYYESENRQRERIKNELLLSRNLLKNNLGKKSFYICWPWGEYNDLSISIAKELGYKCALTTQKGPNSNINDIWKLKRIKAWSYGNWWFGIRLFCYSNTPLANFFSIFTK